MKDKKRQIGDKVWVLDNHKIKNLEVVEIVKIKKIKFCILAEEDNVRNIYDIKNVFDSRAELIESLTYQILNAHE